MNQRIRNTVRRDDEDDKYKMKWLIEWQWLWCAGCETKETTEANHSIRSNNRKCHWLWRWLCPLYAKQMHNENIVTSFMCCCRVNLHGSPLMMIICCWTELRWIDVWRCPWTGTMQHWHWTDSHALDSPYQTHSSGQRNWMTKLEHRFIYSTPHQMRNFGQTECIRKSICAHCTDTMATFTRKRRDRIEQQQIVSSPCDNCLRRRPQQKNQQK